MELVDYNQYNLVLPEFEGPLDLLLHLVKKHELDIFNIPISFITAQYVQALDTMRALNMDLASEYLLMAATLAYIKSRELLPPEAQVEDPEAQEEAGDPRELLIKRLLEYQKYKAAAYQLLERPVFGRNVWARGATPLSVAGGLIDTAAPLGEVPVWELIDLLAAVLGRTRRKMTHEVTFERLSLADRINELSEELERTQALSFEEALLKLPDADPGGNFYALVVLTFMAVLEMARLRLLQVFQADPQGTIFLRRAEGSAAAVHTVPPSEDVVAAASSEAGP